MVAYLLILSAFFQQAQSQVATPSAGEKGYINYPAIAFKYKHTGYELTGKDLPPFKAFDRSSPIPVTFKGRNDVIRKVWFTVETVKPTGEVVTIIVRDYYWSKTPWPVNKQMAGNMMKKRLGMEDSKPASTRSTTPSSTRRPSTTSKPATATQPSSRQAATPTPRTTAQSGRSTS